MGLQPIGGFAEGFDQIGVPGIARPQVAGVTPQLGNEDYSGYSHSSNNCR